MLNASNHLGGGDDASSHIPEMRIIEHANGSTTRVIRAPDHAPMPRGKFLGVNDVMAEGAFVGDLGSHLHLLDSFKTVFLTALDFDALKKELG